MKKLTLFINLLIVKDGNIFENIFENTFEIFYNCNYVFVCNLIIIVFSCLYSVSGDTQKQ